jgi:Holliday junction resolvasome RuvABC endonuclease subunit
MMVLGFDPSLTNFGWAIHDTSAPIGSSTRCLDRGRFQTSAKTLFVDRYCELRESVLALVERFGAQYGLTHLGLEYPVFKDLYSEGMYGLFLYTCEALKLAHVNVVFFSPGQVKAHAAAFLQRPRGWKMGKPDMVEAAKVSAGGGVWNHNEADAYWVAHSAGRFWLFQTGVLTVDDLTPLERKQFTDIHTYQRGKKAGTTVERGILYREDERFFLWSQEG